MADPVQEGTIWRLLRASGWLVLWGNTTVLLAAAWHSHMDALAFAAVGCACCLIALLKTHA
jgi:hypothetical protein